MTGSESLGASRVEQMVCPLCARMNGQEHVAGCPGDTADGPESHEYAAGWIAARNGLLPPFADRLMALREPMHQAYGYLVALVNHGGETETAARKGRDHLREAIRRLGS